MKILSSAQIRELDQYTIEHEPIRSIDLMERASQTVTDWLISRISTSPNNFEGTFHIFCGKGNNGGDGLAISRQLLKAGFEVRSYVVNFSADSSDDFLENGRRLERLSRVLAISDVGDFPEIGDNDIIVDAIFGTGLSRPAEGIAGTVINKINHSSAQVIAVDIPSGLYCEAHNEIGNIVEADFTLTFQAPKLAFLLPENEKFIGKWEVMDIGLDAEKLASTKSAYRFFQEEDALKMWKPRKRFSHKGTYGHALLIAGSQGKVGAGVLTSKACLRSGVGLLTTHIPQCGYGILQGTVPEAMVSVDIASACFSQAIELEGYSAIGIGPGLGQNEQTTRALEEVLQNASVPLVLDADALNLMSRNPELLEELPQNSILTPHPKEFERLTEPALNDYHRLELLQNFCQTWSVYVVLKGGITAICNPEGNISFNTTGNPGMATAGSGDVLTGIITGLLAQGYSPEEACKLGVFYHGKAGDKAMEEFGQTAMLAGDIIDCLGKAFPN